MYTYAKREQRWQEGTAEGRKVVGMVYYIPIPHIYTVLAHAVMNVLDEIV